MSEERDEFLSEEDLDLRNLTDEELITYWNLWLVQAQATNDLDEAAYSHGVFDRDPAVDVETTVLAERPLMRSAPYAPLHSPHVFPRLAREPQGQAVLR